MNLDRKLFFEWMLLIIVIWILQAVQMSLDLPLLGTFRISLILIIYISVSRDWMELIPLGFFFAMLGTKTSGIDDHFLMSALIFVSFVVRLIANTLNLGTRPRFCMAIFSSTLLSSILVYLWRSTIGETIGLGQFSSNVLGMAIFNSIVAWFLLPVFRFWDYYFEHEIEDRSIVGSGHFDDEKTPEVKL